MSNPFKNLTPAELQDKIYDIIYKSLSFIIKERVYKDSYEAGINPIWRPVHGCIELSVRRNISEHVKDYEFK